MDVLDKVTELQSQGLQDEDINKQLRDEGFSPQEINDALSQARVKEAVSAPQGMEQSISEQEMQEYSPQAGQEYAQGDQQYGQDQYQPQQLDTDTISEIAEQVVQEKFSEFNKKTGDIVNFKNEVRAQLQDIDERIKRIESALDNIQKAIIGKIGEYGENIAYVHKDLENIHETVSKLMNPLIDNYRELKKLSEKK
jgi:DNA-binding transcriptional MerR regulator